MTVTILQKGLFFFFLLLIILWIYIQTLGIKTNFWNYFYSFSFSLIPLIGGILGITIASKWGLLKSAMGKAILFISLGSLSWGAGSMVWSYYNFFIGISAPYPSLADLGFILAIPLWIFGCINLSKATGARFALSNIKAKLFISLVPIFIVGISYYLLVIVARNGILSTDFKDRLKLFFDLAYPIGDVLILSLTILIFGLSFKYFGGAFKIPIFLILFGFCMLYLADFVFSYTTTAGTFYNGNFGDLIFTVALFLIIFGIFGFDNSMQSNK